MIRRLARVLVRPFLPRGYVGDSMLMDLDREHERRFGDSGGVRGTLWYLGEAWSLAIHHTWARLMRPFRDRDARGGGYTVEQVGRDIQFALRRLGRRPAFALVAVLTIALGIGSNVAIFSVVKTVVLDPLPYEAPEELVALWEWNVPRDRATNVANPGNVRAWRERSETIEELSYAVFVAQPLTLTGVGEPRETAVKLVGPGWFDLLGMDAVLGRTFTPEAGATEQQEVVLSHRFWRSFFGGDAGVLGRSLTIDGQTAVVVGVMGPEYVVFSEDADLWASFPLRGDQTNTGRYLQTVARLADGVTVDRAREELRAIAAGLREEYPDFNAGWSVSVVPLREEVVGEAGPALWILFGAVSLLLLIACGNVANLFLASATERQRELAVRTSLGASAGRLTGQLFAESLVVATAGAMGGVWLAHVGTGLLAGAVPDAFSLPRIEAAGVDGTVLLFAVALTVLTGLLFGLAPALQARGIAPAVTLNAEGRGPSQTAGRLRNGLVVLEVALSLLLLVGAGLLARSFVSLTSVETGLDAEQVVTAHVSLSGPAYQGQEPDVRFFREYQDRVARLPGVGAAGGITWLPMDGMGSATSFRPLDRPAPPPEDWPVADIRNVIGDYFQVMGIGLRRGRLFTERDREDAPAVAVVNAALAESQWPGEDPIGKRIGINWSGLEEVKIVGVVENVRLVGYDTEPRPAVYLHYPQKPYFGSLHMVVRASTTQGALVRAMANQLQEMDPSLALSDARTIDAIMSESVARPRLTAVLMAVFAALAAMLAAVGLYGVLAYTVSKRVREIGVRIAIGARPGHVVRMVVRQGLAMAGAGLVLGLAGAVAGARVVESLLFGVEPLDPISLAAATLFLLLVAAVAAGVPAWRAARVAPMEALRVD